MIEERPIDEDGIESPEGDAKEQRAYFRVRTEIPVRLRVVEGAEIEAFARELAVRRAEELPAGLPRAVAARLDRLERKLDFVLAALDPMWPRPLGEADVRRVELSGSGARFGWPEAPAPGTDVMLELLLPCEPVRNVRAIARVVRQIPPERDETGGSVALAYQLIDEADRAAIVRFSYDVQRLAMRRSQDGAPPA